MNENVLNLIIKAQNLASGVLNSVGNELTSLQKKAQNLAKNGFESMGNSFKKTADILKTGTVLIAGLGAGLIGFALNSASQIETMGVSLETAFGGNIEMAQNAQKSITEFATKTPYELNEVMRGFIKLKNMGLDPSEKAMTSYGNTASSMGKSLNDMVEAVADAATGEFERLKEFGIRSKSEGDKVTFTFKGVATTVGKNSKEIEDYLIKLGETNFAGGMEKQSQTFAGKLSTLKDTFAQTMAVFANDTGLLEWAKKAVDGANLILSGVVPAMAQIKEFGNLIKLIFGSGFIEEDQIPMFFYDLAQAIGGLEARQGVLGFIRSLKDSIGQISAFIQPVIDKFNEFNANNQITNSLLVGLATTIGVLLVGALASILIPLALVILPFLALGLAVSGITLAFQNQSPILEFLLGIWNQLSTFISTNFAPELETLNSVWNNLTKIFETVVFYVQPLIAILYVLATQALQAVFYAIDQLRQPINDFIQAVMNAARPIMDILAPAFVFIVGIISAVLIPTFQILWAIVVQVFKGILETITGVINMIAGVMNFWIGLARGIFTGDFSQMMEGFKQMWQGLGQFLNGIIDTLLSPIRGFIDGIGNIFNGFSLAQIGANLMTTLGNGLWQMFDFALGPLTSLKNSILNVLGLQKQANAGGSGGGSPVSGKGGAWAKGGAFENGSVVKFATGGVVSSPTNFGMSGGRTGLMGEAGPEAIMPLTRGSDGKLGVKASGGGQSPNITINMNIGTLLGTERDRLDLVKILEDALRKQLKLPA